MFVTLNGVPVDAVTRQALPQGTVGQGLTGQGDKGPVSDPTMANRTAATEQEARLDVLDEKAAAIRKLVEGNAGITGLPAQVRGFVQNAGSVLDEFRAAFGNTPLDAAVTPETLEALKAKTGTTARDPAIAQFRVMALELAYARAQTLNPQGEVSRQALERQIEAISGGSLPNNQSFLEALSAIEAASKMERTGVRTRRGTPAAAPAGAPAAPAGPRVIETPAGKVTIEPVQ
jgi:hypothetical protein